MCKLVIDLDIYLLYIICIRVLTMGRRTVSLKLHADGMTFGQVRHERLKLVHLTTTNIKSRYMIFK